MRKTIETNRDWHEHWATVGQRVAKDELLRQVERTVSGQPISEGQIDLLIQSIKGRLNLNVTDVLLDLCCGNGLITRRLSGWCRAVVGMDYSAALIAVAWERHAAPNTSYLHRAADDLDCADFPMGPPSKVSMNQGLQFFTPETISPLLQSLRKLVRRETILYFTDVPDAAKVRAFYNNPERWAEFQKRRAAGTEAIGTWWDRDHLKSLMEDAGYKVRIIDPEPARFTAHYRFDALAYLK